MYLGSGGENYIDGDILH